MYFYWLLLTVNFFRIRLAIMAIVFEERNMEEVGDISPMVLLTSMIQKIKQVVSVQRKHRFGLDFSAQQEYVEINIWDDGHEVDSSCSSRPALFRTTTHAELAFEFGASFDELENTSYPDEEIVTEEPIAFYTIAHLTAQAIKEKIITSLEVSVQALLMLILSISTLLESAIKSLPVVIDVLDVHRIPIYLTPRIAPSPITTRA
jgi:hypothetical protein